MSDSRLEDKRVRILHRNNAQEIVKALADLEEHRAEFATRWLWELIQNARDFPDESRPMTIRITLPGEGDRPTFLIAHGKAGPFANAKLTSFCPSCLEKDPVMPKNSRATRLKRAGLCKGNFNDACEARANQGPVCRGCLTRFADRPARRGQAFRGRDAVKLPGNPGFRESGEEPGRA